MKISYSLLSTNAEKWMIAFYGYGQQADVFAPLAKTLEGKYNLLVIDLPLAVEPTAIEKKTFITFLEELISFYEIKKITGVSYSMGSRFNLVIAECRPDLIEKLILVAPDGIRMRIWNRFSTSTLVGNYIFRYLVESKNAYATWIRFLYQLKLMPKSMYAFSKWHMRDLECRSKVYNAWINMKKMIPTLRTLRINQSRYAFDIIAFFGESDSIINHACRKKLARHIPSTKIITLKKGHNLLDEELFNTILELV